MSLLLWALALIASLALLIRASDYFTYAAEKIGLRFGLPTFIVGVTIVAIGTSLPELVTCILSVFSKSSEIVIGNVLGSNIANICLVLGVAGIIGKKIKLSYELLHVDLPLLIGSAFLLALTAMDGVFTLGEGLIFIAGIILYFAFTIRTEKKADREIKKEMTGMLRKRKLEWKTWAILAISAVFIYLGAHYTIESVIKLSEMLFIGKEIIAATAIALGTSLPELGVTISAAKKGKPEMAVGNVLGSNIFNTFAVMGVPSLIGTLLIPVNIIYFALPFMVLATFLYLFITQDKDITKWEGWLLILFYILFIGKILSVI